MTVIIGGGGATAVVAHKSTHATGGADALAPADIGAATSGHTHGAAAPASHASSHASGGADAISPSSIGAIAASTLGANNGTCPLDAAGLVPTADLPTVIKPPQTFAYASSIQPDLSYFTHYRTTCTGSITLNNPTGATDGQRLYHTFSNTSGSAITVSLGTLFEKLATIDATLSVPSGKVGHLTYAWDSTRTRFVVLGWDYTA